MKFKSQILPLLLALLLGVAPSWGQTGANSNAGLDGWLNHLSEGQPGALSFQPTQDPGSPSFNPLTRPTYTSGSPTTLSTSNSPLGRTRIILSAWMSADQMCTGWLQYGQSGFTGAISASITQYSLLTGSSAHFFDFGRGYPMPELSAFTFGATVPAGNAPFIAGGARYVDMTSDPYWDARYILVFIGDSITYAQNAGSNGTTGQNGNNGFPMRITRYLRGGGTGGRGVSVRHVNYGVSGMTSAQCLIRLNDNTSYTGVVEKNRVAVIVEMMGMNDAQTSVNTSQANFNNYLAGVKSLRDTTYPQSDILYVGPSSTNDSAGGRTTNIANFRTWKQQWVGANGGSAAGLFYFDASTCYDTSAGSLSANFAETSNQIHPNIAGHGLLETDSTHTIGIGPAISQTNWGQRVLAAKY